jgi:hypothetical protein
VTPSPDVRDYFADGFMDRVAYRLLTQWLYAGAFPTVTPIGQFGITEWEYTAERPAAFKAGSVAWDTCVTRTAARVRGRDQDPASVEAVSVSKSIRAALRLNTYGSPIRDLDWFVHYARRDERNLATTFAAAATRGGKPHQLVQMIAT